ncbi:hypothetical protein [Silvimonas iriomotensis]|uniref:Uncharacterized protein n=1 Tax=Silvimonas iriomotensis TaxID=449662 RepID=A0ABQ2PFX8_9NEIS|nr:hypothetical protein [Silvimonas iriomotensis]GGP24156.1 hypothetical protein GCM10010970_41560 [Silvimonas iriomotensis]
MILPDPRMYPRVNAANPVIRALMSLLTEREADAVKAKRESLHALVCELLQANDHAALNAALTQAPSENAYSILWDTLRSATEKPDSYSEQWAVPFAIPLILVAGVKGQTNLPGRLADVETVRELLKKHDIFATDADIWLSPQLAHPEQMAQVNPAQLSRWRDQLQYASGGLPVTFQDAPVPLKDEGVFVRYLFGVAIQRKDAAPAVRIGGQVGAWGVPLAQELGKQLQTPGVTLFTIPRVPQTWLAAQEAGRTTQLETQLQVATSNALRSIRTAGRTPVVTLAAHESGEIRMTFCGLEDGERWEGFVWPLAPLDHTEQVVDFVRQLMVECQVNDVRVIDAVQPDRVGDLPFFVTAHIAPVTQQ